MTRSWFDPYLESEAVVETGEGCNVGQRFGRVQFAVSDHSFLVLDHSAVTRLSSEQIQSVTVKDHMLRIVLAEPEGATLAWELREPTDWIATLEAIVRAT